MNRRCRLTGQLRHVGAHRRFPSFHVLRQYAAWRAQIHPPKQTQKTPSHFARIFFIASLWLATFAQPPRALAAGPLSLEAEAPAGIVDYWTPTRLKNAKPLRLPQATLPPPEPGSPSVVEDLSEADLSDSTVWEGYEGHAPTVKVRPDLTHRLFTPERNRPLASEDADTALITPQAVGTSGAHFTSSQLVPLSADGIYPYRTVGKLFFTIPGGGTAECSGAVIKPRLVLTAGHCVHQGSGGNAGFFTNFLFVPAFRNGVAPFQSWSWASVTVTDTWATGGGTSPNAADYALLELQDRMVNGSLRRLGDVTGVLGVQPLRLFPNHAHLLGYPGNLDSGLKMHQVTAGSFNTAPNNTVLYGSDMRGGSSGGPWVQNFGIPAVGQTGGLNPGRNQVIGVTSFMAADLNPQRQGSSVLDSRFTEILNIICRRRAGNC
jgi:V8-like Glu-specific endopeptidase